MSFTEIYSILIGLAVVFSVLISTVYSVIVRRKLRADISKCEGAQDDAGAENLKEFLPMTPDLLVVGIYGVIAALCAILVGELIFPKYRAKNFFHRDDLMGVMLATVAAGILTAIIVGWIVKKRS